MGKRNTSWKQAADFLENYEEAHELHFQSMPLEGTAEIKPSCKVLALSYHSSGEQGWKLPSVSTVQAFLTSTLWKVMATNCQVTGGHVPKGRLEQHYQNKYLLIFPNFGTASWFYLTLKKKKVRISSLAVVAGLLLKHCHFAEWKHERWRDASSHFFPGHQTPHWCFQSPPS